MDASSLETCAQRLARREAELRLELAEHHGHVSRDVEDFADMAVHDREAALLEVLDHRASEELREVLAARRRLHLGTYADCAQCGEPIGAERLLATPTALLCVSCQQALEAAARG